MREVYQEAALAHTNRYVHFDSHHPLSVKSGVVECLANRAITISSSGPARDAKLKRIKQVMAANGYPKRFVEKAISRQLKRSAMRPTPTALQDRSTSERDSRQVTVNIPLINGLSQEVRRIARVAGVRCSFYAPKTLKSLYTAKDPLPIGSTTCTVYSVKCKTCSEEYVGETLCTVSVRRKEHSDAIRLGHGSKSAIAEHVHNQSHHCTKWIG